MPEFLIEEELKTGRLVIIGQMALETDQAYFLVVPEEKGGIRTITQFSSWLLSVAGAGHVGRAEDA